MTKRDQYWDTLKFVLIFLVVYGHTLSGFSPEDGSFNRAIYNFIFTFHMPLFIFISGRFSHVRDVEKYKHGLLRIFETYIVFQFIRSFIWCSDSLSVHSFLSFLFVPKYTLWYLLCLIYWRLFVMLIPANVLNNKPFAILVLCFSISILGGFIPVKILSLQRAMTFMPFFFMGYYSTNIDLKTWLNKIHIGIPMISVISIFGVMCFLYNFNINYVLHGKSSYWAYLSHSPFELCISRCLFVLVAIFLSIMVMRLVRVQPFMAKMGGGNFGNLHFSFLYNSKSQNISKTWLSIKQ